MGDAVPAIWLTWRVFDTASPFLHSRRLMWQVESIDESVPEVRIVVSSGAGVELDGNPIYVTHCYTHCPGEFSSWEIYPAR